MQNRVFLLFLSALVFLVSCSPRSKKAADYNDSIISYQSEISLGFDALDTTFSTLVADDMDYAYLMLRSKIETGQRVLDTLPRFKKDTLLLNAAKRLFEFYDDVCRDEYAELVDIMKMPDSLYTIDFQDRAWAIEAQIVSRFGLAQEAFQSAQRDFGEKYNVVFGEEEEEPT
jgi:hypothetical protein